MIYKQYYQRQLNEIKSELKWINFLKQNNPSKPGQSEEKEAESLLALKKKFLSQYALQMSCEERKTLIRSINDDLLANNQNHILLEY